MVGLPFFVKSRLLVEWTNVPGNRRAPGGLAHGTALTPASALTGAREQWLQDASRLLPAHIAEDYVAGSEFLGLQ